MRGVRRVTVHSNDTDVVIFLLHYLHYFLQLGIEDLWIIWYSTLQSYFETSLVR